MSSKQSGTRKRSRHYQIRKYCEYLINKRFEQIEQKLEFAEGERQSAETERVENAMLQTFDEQDRKLSEEKRESAEDMRTLSENARLEAENLRTLRENARLEAEGLRTLSENARREAENLRATYKELHEKIEKMLHETYIDQQKLIDEMRYTMKRLSKE